MKLLLVLLTIFQISSAFVALPKRLATEKASIGTMLAVRKLPEEDQAPRAVDMKMMNDLSWRAAKVKLEEENTKRMLRRKPVKLPYLEARRWVQYNLGPDTKEEFNDLVANGNLRTPYIPKKPEEYYTGTGDWISWEHFLTRDPKVAGREVPPATGRFD